VRADRRRRAVLPVVERIAQGGEIGPGDVGARQRLVAIAGPRPCGASACFWTPKNGEGLERLVVFRRAAMGTGLD